MALTLAMEIVLLFNVHIIEMDRATMLLLGGSYGLYNCFYWTTQRALFFDLIDLESSGRKYGNFQLFVGASLQVGIVIGGFLLEKTNFIYLLGTSSAIALIGFFILSRRPLLYPATLTQHSSLTYRQIIQFKDTDHSRYIFSIDGLFLFAESFFWVITLFLMVQMSYQKLGFMVLSLAVMFGIIWIILKNTIDRLGRNIVYRWAVVLYAGSWFLRALTGANLSLEVWYLLLVVITFCTTFFRLAMNKRFYDLAKLTLSHDYLILKSYYSQFFIAVGFALLAYILGNTRFNPFNPQLLLPFYWLSGWLALTYLVYGYRPGDKKTAPPDTFSA